VTAGRSWWGALRLALGLGLLVVVLVRTDAGRILPQLAASPWLLPLFVLQALLGYLVEAQRLVLLLRSQQIRIPLARALRVCVTAVPFGYVVPGGVGGDVMKVVALARGRSGRSVELAAVVLVDRATGLVSLLLVAVSAWLLSGSVASTPAPLRAAALAALIGLAGAGTGFLVAWSPAVRASRPYRFATTRLPLHAVLSRVLDAIYAFRDHRGAIAGALALTAIGHAALAGFFVVAARALLPLAPAALVVWVSLLALVANVLPLTPGGLGVGEAAFEAAFRVAGHGGGAQLLLLWRLGVLPFAALGGALYILGDRARDPAALIHSGAERE
jgi:uncharacterized membrane protein YbhN (UPF0104 family)